jgi:5-formyltetrahydrofolate cyclo-ligase
MMDVASVRKNCLKKRAELKSEIRLSESSSIADRIRKILREHDFECPVFCFYPLEDEPDIRDLYQELLKNDRKLFFPVSGKSELDFYEVRSLDDFREGTFGVMEPSIRTVKFDRSDFRQAICIVPGVCFDKNCNRIGFGKGYYDRFLSKFGSGMLKIGVCFRTCLSEELIPVFSHDIPMDIVVAGDSVFQRGD